MNLDDLSAEDLALIDEVCLEFERAYASENRVSVESALATYKHRRGGAADPKHLDLIRDELQAIELELSGKPSSSNGFEASGNDPGKGVTDTLWATPRKAMSSSEALAASKQNGDDRSGTSSESVDRPSELQGMVGPYEISEVIAHGGMGIVYRATDPRLGRPVAIKTLWLAELSRYPKKRKELVDRFEREARAVASLSHPNIVELFDVGVTDEQPYAVMEFIDGRTLADRLAEGKLTVEQTRHLGMQVAGALATSHKAGVIHRDLKPQNIMLVDDQLHTDESGLAIPRAKLVDFGLSRISDAPIASDGDDSATRAGMILGTPGYMSPEQARGEPATDAADVFGLGCVLYEALYGKRAIQGETPVDRLAATLRGSIEFEASACETSAMICELIKDCLAKDPKMRPTASDLYTCFRKADLPSRALVPAGVSDSPSSDATLAIDAPKANAPSISRRHAMTAVAGGAIGAVFGVFEVESKPVDFNKIESIAVLTLRSGSATKSDGASARNGQPLGSVILKEDILTSAIVAELSKVEGLAVIPYRPRSADEPSEWKRLGQQLGVDALLMGTYYEDDGEWVLYWKLVAPMTGQVLVTNEFSVKEKGNAAPGVIHKAEAAADVAERIGRYLVTTSQGKEPLVPGAYECLVKGKAYADGDSTEGLLRAMMCFERAHEEDMKRVQPLASIALVSLSLASRTKSQGESLDRVEDARKAFEVALKKKPDSLHARLASMMYEWQILLGYEFVREFFESEDIEKRYDWQFQHQRGLYFAATGRGEQAVASLQRASRINPMSMLVKTDLLRSEWFFGWDTKVEREAKAYLSQLNENDPGRLFVMGLLVDFYEEQLNYAAACTAMGIAVVENREQYFESRSKQLTQLPYGPFGFDLNRAILSLRTGNAPDDLSVELKDSNSPMFPLLLACHPAFFDLKASPEASQYLPNGRR